MRSIDWIRAALLAVFGLAILAGGAAAEKRVALVIGNAAYKDAPLKNPVNDARLMAGRLEGLGFEVILRENATRAEMGGAVVEFAGRLAPDTAALIYYAGHGIQSRGRNYMIPVDAALGTEFDLRFQAVDVSALTEAIEQAQSRVSFLILDACRNNPFERRLRGAAQGLAAVDAARGALIAYATAPGSVAADGEGRNGTYTEELAKALTVPGLKAEEVFKRVTAAVEARTKGQQTPWISSSLRGDFVFNASAPAGQGAVPAQAVDRETVFWQSIQASTRAADFEAYLAQFPQGTFAALARNRLAEARKATQLAAAPAPAAVPAKPEIVIEPIDKPYVAVSSARLRDAPDLKAGVLATLKEGESAHVLGKVKGQNWYQVERKGQAPGYVASTLLQDASRPRDAAPPARQQAMAPPAKPAAKQALPPIDHDDALRRLAALARRTLDALPPAAPNKRGERADRMAPMAAALCWAGDQAGARHYFDQAVALALSDSYEHAWWHLAKLGNIAGYQGRCGDRDGAREVYRRALGVLPRLRADDDTDESYRYSAIAEILLAAGDVERALAHADESDDEQIRAQARYNAAALYAWRDPKDLAEDDRQRALRIARDGMSIARPLCAGDDGWVCNSLGTVLARLGDFDGAAHALDLLTHADRRVSLQTALGEALGKAGDGGRARAHLAAALAETRALDPQYGADDSNRAWIAGANALIGDVAAAEAAVGQIGRSESRDDGWSGIAYAQAEAGNLEAAARTAERMALPHKRAGVLAHIAAKHRRAGDAAQSEALLARARQAAEQVGDPKQRSHLGYAAANFALAGDTEFMLRILDLMIAPGERHWGLQIAAQAIAEDKRKPR
ncbi:MAG: caspase family protein [Alphaproteobacteria bacterium]|nr:caspase family protein [Alphaproteobacteria bacterium]